jgi:cell cycle arrest protein BUB3
MSEIQLSSPPADGITNVVFGRHTPDSLLVSSWDNSVRLYNTTQNVQVHQYQHKAAVLDVCFGRTDSQCFSGSVDRSVRVCDLSTGVDSHVGSHDNSVKATSYLRGAGVLVTGRLCFACDLCAPLDHVSLTARLQLGLQHEGLGHQAAGSLRTHAVPA